MARADVVHSEDAVTVIFEGNKRKRIEPSTGIIKFPGGHVEVARCTNGDYWVHVGVVDGVNIVDGRIDRKGDASQPVTDLPDHEHITNIAIRVANKVPHPALE